MADRRSHISAGETAVCAEGSSGRNQCQRRTPEQKGLIIALDGERRMPGGLSMCRNDRSTAMRSAQQLAEHSCDPVVNRNALFACWDRSLYRMSCEVDHQATSRRRTHRKALPILVGF